MAYANYVAIDIETTGLSKQDDKIIEIAAVRVRSHEIVDMFSELVNPGYHISQTVTRLTGITNEMLEDAPSINMVLPSFFAFIGKDIVVGHNIRNFDIPFINEKAKKLKLHIGNKTVDTLHLSRYIYPSWEHHRLSDLVKNLNVSVGHTHRALDDAIATHECYQKMPSTVQGQSAYYADVNTRSTKKYGGRVDALQAAEVRRKRAKEEPMEVLGKKGSVYQICGAEGEVYETTLYSCTCPDFIYRKNPCKHMYKLEEYLETFGHEKRKKSPAVSRNGSLLKNLKTGIKQIITLSQKVANKAAERKEKAEDINHLTEKIKDSKFIEIAKPYFESEWAKWEAVHSLPEQQERIYGALNDKMEMLGMTKNRVSRVRDNEGKMQFTGLSSCTCSDFYRHGYPCKHMYKLASIIGVFDLNAYCKTSEK